MDPLGNTTLYPMPPNTAEPIQVIRGYHDDLWFVGSVAWIGRITTSGAITFFPLSYGSHAGSLARGLKGTIWFTDGGNRIGRMSADGTIVEFVIPTPNAGASQITLGPDGAMWFSEFYAGKIGRVSPDGSITEYAAAVQNPSWIASGPGNAISYSSVPIAGEAYVYTMTLSGQTIRQVDLGGNVDDASLLASPSGDLWVTVTYNGYTAAFLEHISATGFVKQYFPPNGQEMSCLGATFGSDGSIWIADPANSGVDVFFRR